MSFLLFHPVDCRENVLLQSVYHPGLFVNSKWSCCDHRSKHSQGCTPSFCGPHGVSLSHNISNVSTSKPSASITRAPLPPTPADTLAPLPPPHSSHYHQNHGQIPNSIQNYEHHDTNTPKARKGREGGGGEVGGSGRGGAVGLANDRSAKAPLPAPPVPVSVCWWW